MSPCARNGCLSCKRSRQERSTRPRFRLAIVTTLEGGTPLAALALGALVDYPALEPAEIKVPTLWLVGGTDTTAMENVKVYEGKLAGTNVTLKVLGSASYSDCFLKIDDVLPVVEPFLASAAATR